jgi:hypothetical protein
MLSVNFKPVISGVNFNHKIVLTDDAYTEPSVVWMDKKDAPMQDSLAWVTIKDPNASGNMLEKWMYVKYVLYEEYVDVIIRDQNGNPVLDQNGMPSKKSIKNTSGYVRVILHEHKHILTRSMFTDCYNVPSLLSHVLQEYQLIEKYNCLNELDWDGIHDLISHRGVKLFTNEVNDNRPPVVPVNMNWRGLYLADGLDDLLYNFQSRVIELPEVIPTPLYLKTLNHNDPPLLTNLTWRKRQFVNLPPNIVYDNIVWPEETNESRFQEINTNRVTFVNLSTRDFERLESPTLNSNLTGPRLRCDKVIAGGDRTAIRNWLNQTFINRFLFYAFTTRRLPSIFITSYDWSKIEFVFSYNNYAIMVQHLPRNLNRMPPPTMVDRKETFVGRVTSMSPGVITVKDLRNLSSPHRDMYLSDTYALPINPNNFGLTGADMIGKDMTFQIANNTVVPVSTSSLYSPFSDNVHIQPLHNGNVVSHIRQSIEYLDYECADEDISFKSTSIFDYTYDSHEINSSYPDDQNEIIWKLQNNYPLAFNVQLEAQSFPTCRVTFKLKATRSELITYLESISSISEVGEEYVEAIADFWIASFEKVDIVFNFSVSPTRVEWKAYYDSNFNIGPPISGFLSNIRPDIDSSLFVGPRGVVKPDSQSFPLSFPDPGVRVTNTAVYFNMTGSPGWNYETLRQELAKRYIANHLEKFPVNISLIYE